MLLLGEHGGGFHMNLRAAIADFAISVALVVTGVAALALIVNAFFPLWP